MLELVEGLLQHVLGVNLLHTQQVQDHVIGQVEGAVQRVSRTLLTESDSEKERNQADLITVYNHTFLFYFFKSVQLFQTRCCYLRGKKRNDRVVIIGSNLHQQTTALLPQEESKGMGDICTASVCILKCRG